jgi:phosphate transport system substrate-binding protein
MNTKFLPGPALATSLLAASAATSATFALVFAIGCTNYSEDGKPPAEPTFATTQVRTFSAAGSTFIAPLMSRWSTDYEKAHNVRVNYRSIGSGAGLSELKQGLLTFAVSDAPLGDPQLKDLPALVQVPVTAGPVCVIYNLPGLNAPLRFSGKTLADIYSGGIANWQDPAIARENPGIKLPHTGIMVVHRADGSGTTSIFTSYLSSVSPTWSAKVGHGLDVNWPTGIGGVGSQNVLRDVQQQPGTIGYLELSYARQAGLPVASIQNRAGEFVVPSSGSAALAISAFNDALAQDLRTPLVDPPASAKGAYPISGLTYVLIPRDNRMAGEQRAFRDFISYAISAGQDSAEELSYTKLPASVQQKSQTLLTRLTEDGQPLK